MKVVFPCNGSLVLQKQDLETLKAFYNTRIMQSQMYEIYKVTDSMIQLGTFNYIPQKSSLVLHNTTFLTIDQMRKILNIYSAPTPSSSAPAATPAPAEDLSNKPISDNDIKNNPFFQTLKPLN